MPNINILTIGGNLTRDPELRVTPRGTSVCTFTVANNSTWTDSEGQPREEVCFLDVEAWGRTGETIAKHFSRGSPIIVWGKLKYDTWDDKQSGQKRSKHRLKVMWPAGGFDFCGRVGAGGDAGAPREEPPGDGHVTTANDSTQTEPPAARPAPPPRHPATRPTDTDDDVPF